MSSVQNIQGDKIDRLIDLGRLYLTTRSGFGFPMSLIASGIALRGDPPLLLSAIAYAGRAAGFSVPDPSATSLPFEVLSWICIALGLAVAILKVINPLILPVKQLVLHYSYGPIPSAPFRYILKQQPCWVSPKHLDQTRANLSEINGVTCAAKWIEKRSKKIKGTKELFYCSTAHLPLVGLLGFRLRTFSVRFFEINHFTKRPILLPDQATRPPLSFQFTNPVSAISSDVAIAVDVSRRVDPALIAKAVGSTVPIARFEVSNPNFSVVESEADIAALTKQLRDYISGVTATSSTLSRVHIFYAGPTSLMFRFCQTLNETLDPEVVVYNYHRDRGGYAWGIVVNKGGAVVQLP